MYELHHLTDICTGSSGTYLAKRGYNLCCPALVSPTQCSPGKWLLCNSVLHIWCATPQKVLPP